MGTSIALAATHHPQSDGQSERAIQTLIQLLRCYSEEQQDEWERLLPLFQYALNDAFCNATGTTPFRIILGKDPRSPFRFVTGEELRETPLGPLEQEADLSRRLGVVNDFVRRRQEEVNQRLKDRYDRTRVQLEFKKGDLVLLSTRSHPKLAGKRKQGRIRVGPYVIKGKRNANAYVLDGLPPGIPQVQNVTFLFPYHTTPVRFATRPSTQAAEPIEVEGELEWEVEEVSDYRQQRNGIRRYLVKWVGTPQKQWLPEDAMQHCTREIRRFFLRAGQPLPPEVNEFCLSSEKKKGQEGADWETERPLPFQHKASEAGSALRDRGKSLVRGAQPEDHGEVNGGKSPREEGEQPLPVDILPFAWEED